MPISLHSKLFRVAMLAVAFAAAIVLGLKIGRTAYARWCLAQPNLQSFEKALRFDPSSCQAYNQLALYYTFSLEDMSQAKGEDLARQATECQPLDANYWITYAMTLQAAGKPADSSAAAERAASLESHNSWILWRTANLQLVNGKTDEALSMFHRVLDGAPEFAQPTFASCWKATGNGELILQKVVPDSTDMNLAYLAFLANPANLDALSVRNYWNSLVSFGKEVPLQATFWELDSMIRRKPFEPTIEETAKGLLETPSERKRDEEERVKRAEKIIDQWDAFVASSLSPRLDIARQVWQRLLSNPEPLPQKKLPMVFVYLDSLLKTGRAEEAVSDWDQLAKQGTLDAADSHVPGNLVVNGGFEVDPVNGGFDWRTSRVGGVYTEMDTQTHHEGKRSLAVHFEGLDNLDFHHVFQVVPVKPNTRYKFSVFMKCRSLSGDAGPHFEIYDQRDPKNFFWKTKDVTGTMEWARYDLNLQTGPKSRTLVVRLRRKPGVGLNKRIEGTFWVDDVQLTPEPAGN